MLPQVYDYTLQYYTMIYSSVQYLTIQYYILQHYTVHTTLHTTHNSAPLCNAILCYTIPKKCVVDLILTKYTACLCLCRMAVLVWKQFSDVCPVQTAGLASANGFPHFKSRHLRCQHLCVRLLQRDPRNIQYPKG